MPIQVANDGRLAVDLFHTGLHLRGEEAQATCCSASHLVGSVNGFECNRHLATAIANENDIIGQQIQQLLHISAGAQELLCEACLLLAGHIITRLHLDKRKRSNVCFFISRLMGLLR